MKTKPILPMSLILSTIFIYAASVYGEEIKPIKLLAPQTEGGRPLMQALKDRKSSRSFSTKELPLQVMSDMLWAANGINRPETGRRTAPSAKNRQEIDVYVARADGLYLYDANSNMLMPVAAGDIRGLTGKADYVKDAPVNLVYVADLAKTGKTSGSTGYSYASADTGFIGQNVYLYCASSGLATVVRGSIDRPALAEAMKLRAEQKVILAQTVGYPKD